MIIGTGQRIIKNEYRPDQQTRADFLQIDGRVHAVDIPLVQLPAQQLNGLTKPLEVDHLPLPEELDDIVHIGVIRKPQDVVVGYSCLLLWHAAKSTTIEN